MKFVSVYVISSAKCYFFALDSKHGFLPFRNSRWKGTIKLKRLKVRNIALALKQKLKEYCLYTFCANYKNLVKFFKNTLLTALPRQLIATLCPQFSLWFSILWFDTRLHWSYIMKHDVQKPTTIHVVYHGGIVLVVVWYAGLLSSIIVEGKAMLGRHDAVDMFFRLANGVSAASLGLYISMSQWRNILSSPLVQYTATRIPCVKR